ncbi:MAG: IS1380 family transposase, partial [Pseudomonadales bacterium]
MGEAQVTLFEPEFNRSIKVQTSDQRITSHAGAILLRELDHQLGLVESLGEQLTDPRNPDKIRYTATELLRERIYALALGSENQDDLDRLAHDPAMRMATWDRPGEEVLQQRLASQPTQSRLIDWLGNFSENRQALRHSLFDWTHRHLRSTGRAGDHAVMRATIDIDSFPIQVHGQQQGSSYNGYYLDTVYHPQVASFSVNGDYDSTREGHRLGNGFIHATLRQGQVHTSQGAVRFIERVVKHARQMARSFDVRLDAGYTIGKVMDKLSNEKVRFCGRLKKNAVLDRLAEPHLSRPPGRPPAGGYEYVVELGQYQAQDDRWEHAQRLILVVVDKPDPSTGQLNLLPRYFFLITNW